jgi:hypothetical protein
LTNSGKVGPDINHTKGQIPDDKQLFTKGVLLPNMWNSTEGKICPRKKYTEHSFSADFFNT